MQDELFPTEFARRIGEECGLLEKHKRGMDNDKYCSRNLMMQEFQQMAVSNPLKDCLIAFHGVKIKKKHKEALAIIYQSTRPWTLSYATTTLLKKLQRPSLSGADAKNITDALKENLIPDEKSRGKNEKPAGRYEVRLARID